jgi:serine protease AprX
MTKFFLSLIFFVSLFTPSANTQVVAWRNKVEAQVLADAQQKPTDFIVWMGEQTDLEEARGLKTKLEKGEFVFKKLSETAEQTQKNVLHILVNAKAKHYPFVVVNAVAAHGNLSLIEALASLPEVKMILTDPAVKMQEPIKANSGERAVEWGVHKIKADSVWLLGYNGAGVVVAGEDTGYDWNVPALKGKYRGWNGTYPVHSYNWFDAVDSMIAPNTTVNPFGYSLLVPTDDQQHGTHTMGTMVGEDGANQIGVAPGAKWIGCRNMDRGWGKPSSYTKCFNWFLAPRDSTKNNPMPSLAPDVINNSWGCPPIEGCTTAGTYALMEQAVNNLKLAGIVVVVSAGNDGNNGVNDCETVNTPAAIFENSFSVGATDISDNIADFSSRGPATYNGINRMKPNISAPGVNVRSCVPLATGTYANFNGTSMAGPHVAGAVALIISAKPSLRGQVDAIETLLETTAFHITTTETCGGTQGLTPNNTFGHGRIDVLSAVAQALPIKLLSFYLKVEDEGNHLFWDTEIEANSSHFEIEKSTDGISFKKVGQVKAAGFSVGSHRYDLLDKDTSEGVFYYRLKQVDRDLTFEYSKKLTCRRVNKNHVKVGPNPSTGQVNIMMNLANEKKVKFEIINVAGQNVQSLNFDMLKGYNELTLNLDFLPKGFYSLRAIDNASQILFQKSILLH